MSPVWTRTCTCPPPGPFFTVKVAEGFLSRVLPFSFFGPSGVATVYNLSLFGFGREHFQRGCSLFPVMRETRGGPWLRPPFPILGEQ